jgi:exodeoxyribonuclease V gamma subunit
VPWIHLVALTAARPGTEFSAAAVGRAPRGDHPVTRLLGAPDDAATVLADLVAIYDAGRQAPIPLPLKTSYVWAETTLAGRNPRQKAGWKWATGNYPGEDAEPAHERVWGKGFPLAELVEAGLPGYAERLWRPMLEAERRGDGR